ncbi:MAG: hypothetical protein IJD21_07155 [Oscillospiraceae bacterium]|nr:hypothetical protein [Oscillospiraceae bacterium]
MARLKKKRFSINGNGLRVWGLFLMIIGIVGRSALQRQILGVGTLSTGELLDAMNASNDVMTIATMALVCQIIETCAVPIYAFLAVEGFEHTSNYPMYLLRVAGVALLSEIPFNIAMSASLLDLNTRNPVFGLVIGLAVLFFYRHYSGKNLKSVLVKILVSLAALVWAQMLRVEFGACIVLVMCVLWIFRRNPIYQNLAGGLASVACSLISPLFLAAPMGMVVVHFYNGDKGADNRMVNYLSYPVVLLGLGLFSMMVFKAA